MLNKLEVTFLFNVLKCFFIFSCFAFFNVSIFWGGTLRLWCIQVQRQVWETLIIWCGKTAADYVRVQHGVVSAAADAVASDAAGVSKERGRWGELPRVGGGSGGYVPGYTSTVWGAGGVGILLLLYEEKTSAKTTDARRKNWQRFVY